MVRTLLIRGMLVGIVGGLLAFGFAKVFGEPQVDRAIAFEATMMKAMNMPDEPELVSREVQSTIGLLTGVVTYGAAFGGLFALVFAFAYGRVGRLGPRATSALLASAGFVAVVLVPDLKYPANPPSVGEPATIGFRTEFFFLMILISISAMAFALVLARGLSARRGTWNATLIAGAAFIAIIAIAQLLLPTINEVPADFPAVVLWQFRVAALGTQIVIWTTLGLLFGALTERSLASKYGISQGQGAGGIAAR
jgi:hypothetical protein